MIPSDGLSFNVLDSETVLDIPHNWPCTAHGNTARVGPPITIYSRMEENQGWQVVAVKKRQIQRDLLSLHLNHVNETAHHQNANSAADIATFNTLAAQLSSGEVSCENVIKAYISR